MKKYHEIRKNRKLDYHSWWKSFTLGLLSLGASGSIGAEASTTVFTAGMINWRGGKIFPAIFASVAVGTAIAQFIPIQPAITVSLAVVASVTIILEKPLLTAILLIFLLPIPLAPLIFITAYIVMLIHKFLLKKIDLKSLIY